MRSKRAILEDDESLSKSDSDRHHNRAPKRQAVPDPETDTPYAAKSLNPPNANETDQAENNLSEDKRRYEDAEEDDKEDETTHCRNHTNIPSCHREYKRCWCYYW